MPEYFAVLTIVMMLGLVVIRVLFMKRQGIDAMQFGKLDKTDFLIPPFALFYFYTVFANTFNLPTLITQKYFHSDVISWVGVIFCFVGLLLLSWSIISLGQSFRIGIDTNQPGKLITTGVFAYSRNPIYVAFAFILLGQFLIFSNWTLMTYLVAATWLFHRQVMREEDYLQEHYGQEFSNYCNQVRRYF